VLRIRSFVVVLTLATGLAAGVAPGVSALCGGTASISDALLSGDAVFVGTVAETRTKDLSALFQVREVWAGGPVATWQPVHVSNELDRWMVWQEDETEWQLGVTYLVVARHRGTDLLASSSCSATQPLTDTVLASRPSTASDAVANSRPLFWAWRPLVRMFWPIGFALVMLIVLGLVVATRSRRRATRE
jgi:hypothetical protein